MNPAQEMSAIRLVMLSAIAMLAFAGNSLFCRLALTETTIDAASFTSIRLLSGALMLLALLALKGHKYGGGGGWPSAVALLVYAAGFSYAYVNLATAAGALLLFGAVQATMIGYGLYCGERLNLRQLGGIGLALVGVVMLFLPGLSAPPLGAAALMVAAGVAWGVYSLRGRGLGDPLQASAGNFLRAVPLALVVSVVAWRGASVDFAGVVYALASGALASGVGYAIWYSVLPALRATSAATLQLSVPALAALGGVAFLDEPVTARLGMASLAILGGVAIYILGKAPPSAESGSRKA